MFLKKLTVRFVEHDRTWRALERALAWVRGEAVLCIAAICAIASMIVVPPDSGYGSYFDTRVLILLFCLMATVAGLKQAGLFDVLARVLLQGNRSFYQVLAALIMLPFFASMLVTNDVALLAFVPFAVLVLTYAQRESLLVWVVVFQASRRILVAWQCPWGTLRTFLFFRAIRLR
ncbi:MAG: SLC13 family permease [Eggerthellaceae bacterium]